MNSLYASATRTHDITAVEVTDSYTSPTSMAIITANSSSLTVGDNVAVRLGYSGNNNRVFQGYVKSIELRDGPKEYVITASNVMVRAVDYFIASSSPDAPYTWSNVSAERLVGDILGLAGLHNYRGQASNFTFGINTEVEVNLVGAFDYAKFIADIVAFHVFADDDGKCYFMRLLPFPNGGSGGSVATLSNSNIVSIQYNASDRDLRNRVVVYGSEGVYAEAKAPSPHLPAGFYKSVVIAAPDLIDTVAMAQKTAQYNLAKLNRLTQRCNVTILGNPNIQCRQNVRMNKADIGVSGKWFIYGINHSFNKSGYLTSMELRK